MHIVELAESALPEHKGFERYSADDDHPMAWDYIPPATGEDRLQESSIDQVNAIREVARANLAKFKGKTKTIDGRVYLYFDDYRRWRGRKVKGRLDDTEGLLLSSWNEWVDANNRESGGAELAGVQVSTLTPWFHDYDYVAHDDWDRAAVMQQKRNKIIARLREYAIGTTSNTMPSLPFESQSCKDKIITWSDRARSFAAELYLTHAATAQIGQRYFDGHAVLFDDHREELDRLIKGLEDIVDQFNNILAPRLPRQRIDLPDIKQVLLPHIQTKAAYFVGRAKAETLHQFDEQDAAVAIIAPYAYGDKSGHVEFMPGAS